MEDVKYTTEYRFIPDVMGMKILDSMERVPRPWDDTLKRERVSLSDFGHWLEQDDARKQRFTDIRLKNPGVQQ